MNESQSFSKPYISSCLVYKQFFSDRTEKRYVRWRLVEDDVTRRSEPALKWMNLKERRSKEMRRLFLELYHKQIFPSTPITSFSSFLSYIVVTPLMLGFEKDFSCHSHLGLIRIPPLFPFPPAPFPRNEKEDGTLELYYLSAYCLPKILLLQLVGHRVIQISCVFCGFPMLQLPYQFGRSGMDWLNIFLGSLVLTLLCGIHSRSALFYTFFSYDISSFYE